MLSRVLRSNLVGQLFERVRPDQRRLVLDMGYASSSTVQFFNQFKCRLNFLDISSSGFLGQRPEEAGHDELVEYFQAGLDLKRIWPLIFAYSGNSLIISIGNL
jgi:hypothetical protein